MITGGSFVCPPKGAWCVYLLCVAPGSSGKQSGQGCRQSYVGITNYFEKRFREHNSGQSRATSGRSWEVSFVLQIPERAKCALVEQWLKTGDTALKRERFQALRDLPDSARAVAANRIILEALAWQARKNLRTGLFKQLRSSLMPEGGV